MLRWLRIFQIRMKYAIENLPKGALESMTDYGSNSFSGSYPPKNDKDHERNAIRPSNLLDRVK